MAAVFVAAATDPVIGRGSPGCEPARHSGRPHGRPRVHGRGWREVMADPDAYPLAAARRSDPGRAARGSSTEPANRSRRPWLTTRRSRPTVTGTEPHRHHDGVDLHVVEAGDGFPGRPRPRLPRAGLLVAPPDPGARRRRATASVAPDQRGYGRIAAARGDRGLRHRCTSPTTCSACSTTSARSGRCSSATTGARWSCGSWRCSHPERVAGVVGMSVPFLPAAPMPPIADDAPGLRRPVLLHPLLPGARRRRRRPRRATPPPRCAACSPACHATERRRSRPVVLRQRRPRLRRPHARARRPARLADARTSSTTTSPSSTRTGFTGGINWYRNFDRNWELTAHLDGAKVEVPSLFIGGSARPGAA